MDTTMRAALACPTYEADFWAVEQMLQQAGTAGLGVGMPRLQAQGNSVYTLTLPGGRCHTHLIREYAIHHLLHRCYTKHSRL